MKVVIQLTRKEELKALPILYRHSPGTVLPNGVYIINEEAARALREAGVRFTELTRDADAPGLEGAVAGERI